MPDPTSLIAQVVASLAAILGILVFFLQVAWIVDGVVAPITKWMRDLLEMLFPPAHVQVEGIDGRVVDVTVPKRVIPYYLQTLSPILLVWTLLQFLFAGRGEIRWRAVRRAQRGLIGEAQLSRYAAAFSR